MAKPRPSVRLSSSGRTSTGLVRENNEDNIHLWMSDPCVLAVIADGMGGAAAGEEASRLAVEAIGAGWGRDWDQPESLTHDQIAQRLRHAILDANDRIVSKALSSPEFRGMGTTVTLAFVCGMDAAFAHVGDSRAYLVGGDSGRITQITSDHSFVEALLNAGHITREQAEEHPMRNVLYRALGQAEDVDVDMYYKQLRVGDRVILCSDGLTRHVKPEEIARITIEQRSPDAASQRLIDLANERGGEDNISVIVIAVEVSTSGAPAVWEVPVENEADTLILEDGIGTGQQPADTGDSDPTADRPAPPMPDERKMTAERLRDNDDSRDAAPLPTHDLSPASRLMNPPVALERCAPASSRSHDKKGEGRDTLLPEQ